MHRNRLNCNLLNNILNSAYDSVIFKDDNFSVGSKGIKQLNTGLIMSVVDPKDFVLGKKLGIGASGSVFLAVYKPTGLTVAIKSINIYDKAKRKQFKNDLKVLWDNNCPFLIKFFGAFFEEGSIKLVLEYMDLGSLDKVITKIKKQPKWIPSEAILSKITQQVNY
jgi:serine/threonine protein kinase